MHRATEDLKNSGIMDRTVKVGDDSWTLPIPARLIICTDGVIRYAEINPDYTERPEPEDTLSALG
jgi:hypothetical protein